jgi:hypothetical protein
VRRKDDSRVEGNMDICGLPAFNLTVCGLPTRMDVDTLRLPRILCNSDVFLPPICIPWTIRKRGKKRKLSAYNKFVSAFSKSTVGPISLLMQQRLAKAKSSGGSKSNCLLVKIFTTIL